jgi:DUF4097 and DUF4098 domain-containing protein YvlB
MRVTLAIAAAAVATLGLSGCIIGDFGPMDRYHTDLHYSYQVQPKARIDAESFNGAIEIEGWDRDEVEISGVKSGSSEEARDAIKIDVHNTPDSVEIRAIKPSIQSGNTGAKFTLHVPRNAEVDRVTTSNASIKITDVGRAAHLKSSNGSITVTGIHGEVNARTSNAGINAESVDGALSLKTSNGRIYADRVSGSLEAETSNNAIVARLAASPSTPVKLTTSNGSIDLTMDKAPQSDIRAETRNNSITVHLPPDTAAKISADTSNSSITSDFDLTGDNEKSHMSGTIGGGGHNIELSTRNGHIRIVKGK